METGIARAEIPMDGTDEGSEMGVMDCHDMERVVHRDDCYRSCGIRSRSEDSFSEVLVWVLGSYGVAPD